MAGSEERHFKFEKVIGALTSICMNIEKTLMLKEEENLASSKA